MNTYNINDIGELLRSNSYPGRGIVIGVTEDGKKAVAAYFIMGRSSNSRNRVFKEYGETLKTEAFDPAKLEDPSLIVYSAIRKFRNFLIVTNGDQTDTIYSYLENQSTFEDALCSREFEPDAPNYTPRISGMLTFTDRGFSYKMSILKSADPEGKGCNRFFYNYVPTPGLGHFIHTYACDGDPIPTFEGEPERIKISGDIDVFSEVIWSSLNSDNKISLFVEYIDIASGETEKRLINKNKA